MGLENMRDYGADAVGGIINLVTYKAGTMPGRLTARGGSHGSVQAELSGGGRALGGQMDIAFGTQVSEGDRSRLVAADLQTQLDGRFNTNASLAPGPMENRYEIYSLRARWERDEWDVRYFNWYNRDFGTGAGISQALDHLLDNAARYAPRGGRCAVSAKRDEQGVEIAIGNSGPPVPPAERDRIFGRYFQVERRRASARENRGLGLYFCKLAVEAHGGTIHVEERGDLGAVFVVHLPERADGNPTA